MHPMLKGLQIDGVQMYFDCLLQFQLLAVWPDGMFYLQGWVQPISRQLLWKKLNWVDKGLKPANANQ
jgi:hypothetical protein